MIFGGRVWSSTLLVKWKSKVLRSLIKIEGNTIKMSTALFGKKK